MLPDPGTWIVPETKDMEQEEVTGIALKTNLGRVTVTGLRAQPASRHEVRARETPRATRRGASTGRG